MPTLPIPSAGATASQGSDPSAPARASGTEPVSVNPAGARPAFAAREAAESFGDDAARYDRTRPDYPAALIGRIVAEAPGPEVLDVGIGTGIAALQLREAGCTVLGLDVDDRMAEAARGHGFAVEVGRFEEWDPRGRTFDAVTAAQAWHWIEPVAGAAKAGQVLRPGGLLVTFWNAMEPPTDLAARFASIQEEVLPGAPNAWAQTGPELYSAMLAPVEAGIGQAGGFAACERWRYDWQRVYDRAAWLDQVPTFGGASRMPPERLARLLAGMGEAIDEAGGSFTMTYATLAVAARRSR